MMIIIIIKNKDRILLQSIESHEISKYMQNEEVQMQNAKWREVQISKWKHTEKRALTVRRLRLPAILSSASSSGAEGRPTEAPRFHFLPLRRYDVSRSSSVLSKLISDGDKIDAEVSPIGSNPLK